MSEILESVRQGRVLRLTLNRPEKRNALSAELCRQLLDTIENAEGDPRVGVILLGANGKAFCAGMDLAELGTATAAEIDLVHEELFTVGARMSKPLVAAVHGAALGGGTGLVANCHIAIASEDAVLGLTEIRLGLWPYLVFRAVSAAVGERRALELALTGRTIASAEARAIGFVHEVVPDAEKRAAEVAETIASYSPGAIHNGLRFVDDVRGKSWRTAGEIARRVRHEAFGSRDFQEGVRAFREKREPRWPSLTGEDRKAGE